MYKNFQNNERKTVPLCNPKLNQKFTKSLTLFNTKNNFSKNITQHNTIKKPELSKEIKSSKTKRLLCSNKKSKDVDYLQTNPISPKLNNKYKEAMNKNSISSKNIPSTDHRLYKYKNGYILNIINNYKPNVIINQKSNKYEYNGNNNNKNKNNNENNMSDNNSDNNSKKTNGTNNINSTNDNNLNSSLIHTENFLNTIAITLTNNNCNENNIQ